MSGGEWVIQLLKIIFGFYFMWWSIKVLDYLHFMSTLLSTRL